MTKKLLLDSACTGCGAKPGERCSNIGIFVRDDAFHREPRRDSAGTARSASATAASGGGE